MRVLIAKRGEGAFIVIQSIFPVHKPPQAPGGMRPPVCTVMGEKVGYPVKVTIYFGIISMSCLHCAILFLAWRLVGNGFLDLPGNG
jgi:hypothetical protein